MVRRKTIAVTLLLLFAVSTALITSGGTASDPLLTLSYFTDTYLPGVASKTADRFSAKANPLLSTAESKAQSILSQKEVGINQQTVANKLGESALNSLIESGQIGAKGFRRSTFSLGESVSAPVGTSFYLESGSVTLGGGALVNLTAGRETAAGSALASNIYYLFPENNAVSLTVNSASAVLRINGSYTVKAPYLPQHTALADALKLLGLFKGTNNGYELTRAATRLEGLIMLIRLMGEETEALAFTGSHPFKDVPVWGGDAANKYVAYAYSKGYTKGISDVKFGSSDPITGPQYVTMVLRALGYSDTAGDFTWDKSFAKGVEIGIYTNAEASAISAALFRRDQVVEASCNALFVNLKNTDTKLIDFLYEKSVFTGAVMSEAIAKIAEAKS